MIFDDPRHYIRVIIAPGKAIVASIPSDISNADIERIKKMLDIVSEWIP